MSEAPSVSKRPKITVFRCDHMRLVVWADGAWRHVSPVGAEPGSECSAGIYRQEAELPENWGSALLYAIPKRTRA